MLLKNPLISVITPTYNAERFIEKCMVSVQGQHFSNYEHILIDGGSSDNTTGLLKTYEYKNNNVRLIIEKDKGIYDAMNKGIKIAAGQWLYFLGADDFFSNDDVLEKVSHTILSNEVQLIYGNVFLESLHRLYDGEFDVEKILTRNISHQAVFYHVSVFQTLGFYDLRYRIQADYDINIRSWLSGRIKHLYIPLTIASFADGGASSMQVDEQFKLDYPYKTVDTLFAFDGSPGRQVNILSGIYRKIYQRYPFGILIKQICTKDHQAVRFAAIAWMFLTLPYHIMKKVTGKRIS